jgi:ribosomal protein S18 acetylase RimI-like enzyme
MPATAEVTTRAFAPADIERLAHIHSRACAIAYAFMQWSYSDAEVVDWMRSKLADWDWGLVDEANGHPVAYLLMSGNHLDQLFILPEHQRHGLGHLLLGAAMARGIRPLTLNVFKDNRPARAFYERHGFGETDRWFNTQDKAIELRYVLA